MIQVIDQILYSDWLLLHIRLSQGFWGMRRIGVLGRGSNGRSEKNSSAQISQTWRLDLGITTTQSQGIHLPFHCTLYLAPVLLSSNPYTFRIFLAAMEIFRIMLAGNIIGLILPQNFFSSKPEYENLYCMIDSK